MNIIDTHAHLDMTEFDADRQDVINRAKDNGVTSIITIGIDLQSSQRAIELAAQYTGVYATVGMHPEGSSGVEKADIRKLADLAKSPHVVGVGEIGLDFYHDSSPRETQYQVLEWQLEMARDTGLPVIIHCREAHNEMLPVLSDWAKTIISTEERPKGVIHCFSGDINIAERYLELGFDISLGGYIGYPSSGQLRETIKSIPINKLVVETDCPFLPPQQYRGKRNEPSYTLITLGILAEIKQIPLEEAARQTTANASALFNL